ncbi:MAG TPA: AIM24 family protein [Verrucomicrobiae bacterium]|nr:AIM24 family protein [Verrucomicrobiae bacterium]
MDDSPSWYLAEGGKTLGPFTKAQVVEQLQSGKANKNTVAFRHGSTPQWMALGQIGEFATAVSATARVPDIPKPVPPPAPLPSAVAPLAPVVSLAPAPVVTAPVVSAQVSSAPVTSTPAPQGGAKAPAAFLEYHIIGGESQCLEVELEPGASVLGEPSMMVCCDGDASIENIDASFLPSFCNRRPSGRVKLVFGGLVTGAIAVVDARASAGALWCRLDALLCCETGLSATGGLKTIPGSAHGEGVVLHRVEGSGLCFLQAGGRVMRRRLVAGESLRVDSACLLACEACLEIDIQHSGEGPRLALLKGPGVVWLQTHSPSHLVSRIRAALRPSPGQ